MHTAVGKPVNPRKLNVSGLPSPRFRRWRLCGAIHSAWSKFISHGYVPGDRAGNLAVAVHLASAVVIMLAGAVQLVPQVRSRFPVFHYWNGRIYMLTAVITSMAGLYMTWIRGRVGNLSHKLRPNAAFGR
jgi:hypothetical protein